MASYKAASHVCVVKSISPANAEIKELLKGIYQQKLLRHKKTVLKPIFII